MEPKTSSLDDIKGRVVADSFEGSSSESDQEDNKYENEAQSKYENKNEGYSTPPGSTITDQKMMMIKRKIAIPNPASAAVDSKAANPKRLREEKVDINESEDVIDVSSKRKKAKVALSITYPVVTDVKKKSSSTGITWTDNEEMAILGGLISFKAENRKYKSKEFYSYIKDRLGQGDSIQVQDKVKSLKRKYIKMQARNQMSLANSHEEKVFILSKIYWGDVKNGETKNTIIDDGDKLKEVKTLAVQQQSEENSLAVQQQVEENSLVVQQQSEENSLVVWQQPEENSLVVVPQQTEENSLVVVQQQTEEHSLVVVQQQTEENSLVVQQQSEENSNQIIFNRKEVQVQAQLDKDQKKEKDQKMPKKNDHGQQKNPKEKNDHDQQKNPKEKSDQILLDGLRHYLERESIDSRWVNRDQLATLKNLWNNLQLSKVRYNLAISEFDVELNQRALEVHKEFGYENDA